MAKKKNKSKRRDAGGGFRRYQATYASIKDYYKDLGQEKSRKEILNDYHRIKYSCKGVPLKRLHVCIDTFMQDRELHKFPIKARIFDWFHFEEILLSQGAYFKDDDNIVLDLSNVGLSSHEFPYSETEGKYNELRGEIIDATKRMSPPPQFIFTGQEGNTFTWDLRGDVQEGSEEEPEEPVAPPPPIIPEEPVASKESRASIETEKRKTLKERQKADKVKQKRITKEIEREKEKQKTIKVKANYALKNASKALELKKAGFSKKEILRILGV